MKLLRFSLRDLLWLVLLTCGCSVRDSIQEPASSPVPCEQSAVLANLPQNSDQRCFGIAIVMEALMECRSLQAGACRSAKSVAENLYDAAAANERVHLPEFVEDNGVRIPLLSRTGLELLSTMVADRYKDDHRRLVAEGATERLASAMTAWVTSAQELNDLLHTDSDQTVAFGGIGVREFPSGEENETTHAFVLQMQSDGRIIVHDPNDPQTPAPCRLQVDAGGILVEWTCRYRDTGLVTTQVYGVVPMKRFLVMAFKSSEE
jgi:hypothetical protein